MQDKGTESRGHYVTCPRLHGVQGQVLGCWDSGLAINPKSPALSLVPQDRHRGPWDTWFGAFAGHTWSRIVIPLLGSWLPPLRLCRFHLLNSELGSGGSGQACAVTVIRKAPAGPCFLGGRLLCLRGAPPPTTFPVGWRSEVIFLHLQLPSCLPADSRVQPGPPGPGPSLSGLTPCLLRKAVCASLRACVCAHVCTRVACKGPSQLQTSGHWLPISLGQRSDVNGICGCTCVPAGSIAPSCLHR